VSSVFLLSKGAISRGFEIAPYEIKALFSALTDCFRFLSISKKPQCSG
jgi:hypothetical protein